jgi:uncharacterized protein YprB with RNaseH-like and TPR domain
MGRTFVSNKIYIEYHGQIDLKNYPELPVDTLRFLSMDRGFQEFDLRKALFFDIETTGTAGGTGTYAFLVGFGFVEEGYFQVRQFFLHDLAEESAFLQAIAEFTSAYDSLVTYNGKCFDTQVLRNRYLMHRREDPLDGKQHIDMLFIARRLWKKRFQECDLVNLERNVLMFHREDDIPGHLIPAAYGSYLRYANTSLVQKVIHHNQLDILSLAVLTARACLLKNRAEDLSAEEHYSLAILYERQKDFSSAIKQLLNASNAEGSLRNSVFVALARNLRRVKDHERMEWLLRESSSTIMDSELCRRLCILCEHDLKDPALAIRLAESQISRMERFRGMSRKYADNVEDWYRRKRRLERKAGRTISPGRLTYENSNNP